MQYMLAPLEDYTDNAFRTLCYHHGADLTFTEMIRLESLAKRNNSALEKIKFYDDTPTIIQLLGNKESSLRQFLEWFKPQDGFQGFNLNCGCIDPKVIQKGYGCALIKRIQKVQSLVNIVHEKGYPISIKMRLGLNQQEKDKKVYLNLIKNVDADFFIVHARHGKQQYNQPADFSIYQECINTGKKIIANGDINNKHQVEALKKLGLAGIMIGREAIKNPQIFNHLKDKVISSNSKIREEYLLLAQKYNSAKRNQKNILKRLD